MKIDILAMNAEFGQYINFITYENVYDDTTGIFTLSSPTATNEALCTIQPFKPFELKMNPEGARLEGAYKIYTTLYFPIGKEEENPTETRAVFNGNTYRIIHRENWRDYYKYVAELLRVDDELPT